MASLLVERRELPQALEFRLKELHLRQQILTEDSKNTTAIRNYAVASKTLGKLLWKMGLAKAAMGYYQTALHLEEDWSSQQPSNADAKMPAPENWTRTASKL